MKTTHSNLIRENDNKDIKSLRLISAKVRTIRSKSKPLYEPIEVSMEKTCSISPIINLPAGINIDDAISIISYLSRNLRTSDINPSIYNYLLVQSLKHYGFRLESKDITDLTWYDNNEPEEIKSVENVLDLIRITGQKNLVEKSLPTLLQRYFSWAVKDMSEERFVEIYKSSGNQDKLIGRSKLKPELFTPVITQQFKDDYQNIEEYPLITDGEEIIL